MKTSQLILLALLTFLLPTARADEGVAPPTPRTVKTQVKILTALNEEANPIPLTEYGDPPIVNEFSFTWGDVFYGGPTFSLLYAWEKKYYFELSGEPSASGLTDRQLVVFPAFGGVLGFNIGGHGFLSAHLELGLGFIIPPYFATEFDLYPRITAGPDFNLGGGWRISGEVDYFFAYVGYGLGVSCSF
ncbi:MAG: hypothetical protein A2Y64_08160 [Candidatus Coatesbacteria bacterium RBG_13_66_14]|uniref:Outer membrane protein beta-barrel domain-containing protein n=1 Tax=Candidatus Coatesbacteria bacterium RBG_13_66_14 TaxID=1817816 RepID=A0A1F5F5L0_9BACT|nr:MAG: hypothetical protein A2Y64_08160 [Candidatus Coatesbacteria bacterium RBG_13_66_14]